VTHADVEADDEADEAANEPAGWDQLVGHVDVLGVAADDDQVARVELAFACPASQHPRERNSLVSERRHRISTRDSRMTTMTWTDQ
jgi:hypothetical protein